ncbi:M28 family peptidase [Streptomyces sp. Je 1-79]|uniref:M28 family peptidase n=1 Tax=Streptomyces sp. Je 1-79 TaxID=2943847 RepID=UPI0021A2B406|nr:M28 family peptidase [Streptomyces sp. Je 1-79]MCT4353748.1 M28 family peptidase [Streptomyces sp. Je 1-79]
MNASHRRAAATLTAAALATPLLLASASPASSQQDRPGKDAAALSKALVREASAKDALPHLRKFQAIADSAGGHRVAGSLGHDASAAYVYQQLKKAGYNVSYQRFDFVYTQTLAEKLSTVTPAPRDIEIRALTYTKSTPVGGVRAEVAAVPVDADGTTGCEPGDYAPGAFNGRIALIKRGGCAFAVKQEQAAAAGAVGALIYNNIDAGYGPLSGTLGDPAAAKIPTGGISKAEGEKLAAELAAGPVNLSFEIRQLQEKRSTNNVIAETKRGNAADTVMLGASLDSVLAGPGINDNGSGSAGLLDVALKLAKKEKSPRNKVRFAWWSAAESGLVGSHHYVANLSPLDKREIRLYLNFELIASTNAGMFVYDGDNSEGANTQTAAAGSDRIERDITAFLGERGLPHAGTPFVARFDYGPFLDAGIPSGGTFSGAEALKTPAEAARFGGTAGVAFDPNYHGAGDTLENISMTTFDSNIDVIAHAVGTYAHDLGSLKQPVAGVRSEGGHAAAGEGSGGRDGRAYGVTE